MKLILSPKNLAILKKFTSGNVLIAFDFDGTLAPIATNPDRAAARPGTRKLLQRLTRLYPCIVVSGRSRNDARRKLGGIRFKEYIGNHGIEPWSSSRAVARQVEAWISVLTDKLEDLQGVTLENKRFSLSVHFRRARDKKKAIQAIVAACGALPGARVFGGKLLVNVVPLGAPDKGVVLERALQKFGYPKAIYVGDDVTDEDVFALGQNGRFLTIRVGANASSLARFYIRDQREIDLLLKTMIDQRQYLRAGETRAE